MANFITKTREEILANYSKRYAFVIGIDSYPKLDANLRNATRDAEQIAMRLKVVQGFDDVLLLTDVNGAEIRTLFDWMKDPDRPPIIPFNEAIDLQDKINWIESKPEAEVNTEEEQEVGDHVERIPWKERTCMIEGGKDAVLFYFAGHGIPGEISDGPTGYLTPSDAENRLVDNDTLVPMQELYDALVGLDCHHTLLILDCCFAGKFRFAGSRFTRQPMLVPMYERRFNFFVKEKAWQVLVSSGPDETAADSVKLSGIRDHSPFAQTLIEALEGSADVPISINHGKEGDGLITASEIWLYVLDKVERMTTQEGKVQHPGLFPMKEHQQGEFLFIPLNEEVRFPLEDNRNSYRGLVPYEPTDRSLFFGRDTVIEELAQKIIDTTVLVVTGPSAVGKSSVVKAGLYPRLADLYGYELLVLRPGSQPYSGPKVTKKIAKSGGGEEQISYWTGLKGLLEQPSTSNKRLLLIDQYEEYFVECEDETEREKFESKLVELVQELSNRNQRVEADIREWQQLQKQLREGLSLTAEEKRLLSERVKGAYNKVKFQPEFRIVITIRSDFEWQLEASDFGKAFWNKNLMYQFLYRLPQMDLDGLRDMLEGPAMMRSFHFEENLVDTILEEVNYAPGALPMLSFTMQQFYELAHERDGQFKRADYNRIGGVTGALRQKANEIYNSFSNKNDDISPEQETMRKILLRLVRINEGQYTSRRLLLGGKSLLNSLNELDFRKDEDDKLVKKVLAILEENYLLVRGRDINGARYIELAHDSLINNWPTYQQWIKDFGKENLVLQLDLWQAVQYSKVFQLEKVSRENSNQVRQETAASIQARAENDSMNNFSEYWDNNPKLLEVINKILEDNFELAATVVPDLNFRSNLFSLNNFILSGTSSALLRKLLNEGDHWLNQEEAHFIQQSWEKKINDLIQLKKERDEARANELAAKATTSSNRKTAFRLAEIAQAIDPGNFYVKEQLIRYQYLSSEPPHYSLDEHEVNIGGLAFSDDGMLLSSSGADNMIRLWDVETSAAIGRLAGHTRFINDIGFWPQRKDVLVSVSHDRTVKIWRENENGWEDIRTLKGHNSEIESLAIAPNGKYIASGSNNGQIILWSINNDIFGTGEVPFTSISVSHHKITTLNFSPDSQKLVMGNTNGQVKMWQIKDNRLADEITFKGRHEPNQEIFSAAFLDNNYAISGAWGRELWRWKIDGAATVEHQLLASVNDSPDFYIRDCVVSSGQRYLALTVENVVYVYEFDADTKTKGKLIYELTLDNGHPSKLAFARGGTFLAAVVGSSVTVWHMNYRKNVDLAPPYDYYLERGNKYLTGGSDRNLASSKDLEFKIEARWWENFDEIELTGKNMNQPKVYNNGERVQFLAFFNDGLRFLSGDKSGKIKIWDRTSSEPEPIQEITTGLKGINHVAISKNDQILIAAWHMDNILKVWKREGDVYVPATEMGINPRMAWGCRVVQFSQDEKYVLAAGGAHRLGGGSLKVFGFSEQEGIDPNARVVIPGRFSYAHFSPDRKLIFSYEFFLTLKVWDVQTGERKMHFPEIINSTWGKLVEDEKKWLVIADRNGRPRAFWYDSDLLVEHANKDPWMGPLTPDEIIAYQLEPYFELAGYLDANGKPTTAVERLNENYVFNIARYFSQKGKQSDIQSVKMDYFRKAVAFFEAARKKGELHKSETYEHYLQDLRRHMA